jgi:simple sugar transport system permease protein/ribose transport system permease protein
VTDLRPRALADSSERLTALAIVGFAAVLVYGAVSTPGFLTVVNLKAILASVGFVGIVAVGMTMIMIGGSLFSLSLGTTAAVTAMGFLAWLHFGVAPALALAAALGVAICLPQGFLVGAFGANPIIVTIGAGALQSGVALGLTGGNSIVPSRTFDAYSFLVNPVFGIPFSVYVLAGLAVVAELVLRRTRFGKELYLIGDNRVAARAAGLRIRAVTACAFGVAGLCAAIAGALIGVYNENASLLLTGTYTYDAISAAVVGGNAIGGGRGSILRTVVGAVLIAALSDMMLLRHYSTGWQIVAKGLIVVAFVALRRAGALAEAA